MSHSSAAWQDEIERPSSLCEFRRIVGRLLGNQGGARVIWRGVAKSDWALKSAIDRVIDEWERQNRTHLPNEQAIRFECALLDGFREQFWDEATQMERLYFGNSGDRGRWLSLGVARHHGLPSRVLDWSRSPDVACYFACINEPDQDGAVWWVNSSELQGAVDKSWDGLRVPYSTRQRGRDLSDCTFCDPPIPWFTKVLYHWPFPRLTAQQALMTSCGSLRKEHGSAIDELAVRFHPIARGRIIIPASSKSTLLRELQLEGIDSASLECASPNAVADRVQAECVTRLLH